MKNSKEYDLRDRTKQFSLRIIKMYSALPKSTVSMILGKQVLRSGTSVGANYREAYRGRSKAEFIAKMGECLKELDETMYWLELLVESNNVAEKKITMLIQETSELTAIFVTIIKKTKANNSN